MELTDHEWPLSAVSPTRHETIERRAMRATVDPQKCQGHLRCIIFAPEVFQVDDYGHAFFDADVPLELEAKTRQAAANCPEGAISIDE